MYYKKYILYFTVVLFILVGCVPLRYSKARGETRTGVYHTVKKGETLWSIAKAYKVPLKKLAEVNNLSNTSFIKAGQKLFIPGAQEIKEVKMPAAVSSDTRTLTSETKPVVSTQTAEPRAEFPPGAESIKPRGSVYRKAGINFIWPVKGKVISDFGSREQKRHLGIDIKAPTGTSIVAARAGKVIYSGATLPGYGNVIIIEHDRDFSTVYAHNALNLVKEDTKVQRGQIIGYVGTTGHSTIPHLHFEIRRRGRAEDPLVYLNR